MLRSDLCDYSDTFIVVKGAITLKTVANNNTQQKGVVHKANAPFRSCILKINEKFIDYAEDLDIVIVTIILWCQEVCGINLEEKLVVVMMMMKMILQGINHLSIGQKQHEKQK